MSVEILGITPPPPAVPPPSVEYLRSKTQIYIDRSERKKREKISEQEIADKLQKRRKTFGALYELEDKEDKHEVPKARKVAQLSRQSSFLYNDELPTLNPPNTRRSSSITKWPNFDNLDEAAGYGGDHSKDVVIYNYIPLGIHDTPKFSNNFETTQSVPPSPPVVFLKSKPIQRRGRKSLTRSKSAASTDLMKELKQKIDSKPSSKKNLAEIWERTTFEKLTKTKKDYKECTQSFVLERRVRFNPKDDYFEEEKTTLPKIDINKKSTVESDEVKLSQEKESLKKDNTSQYEISNKHETRERSLSPSAQKTLAAKLKFFGHTSKKMDLTNEKVDKMEEKYPKSEAVEKSTIETSQDANVFSALKPLTVNIKPSNFLKSRSQSVPKTSGIKPESSICDQTSTQEKTCLSPKTNVNKQKITFACENSKIDKSVNEIYRQGNSITNLSPQVEKPYEKHDLKFIDDSSEPQYQEMFPNNLSRVPRNSIFLPRYENLLAPPKKSKRSSSMPKNLLVGQRIRMWEERATNSSNVKESGEDGYFISKTDHISFSNKNQKF